MSLPNLQTAQNPNRNHAPRKPAPLILTLLLWSSFVLHLQDLQNGPVCLSTKPVETKRYHQFAGKQKLLNDNGKKACLDGRCALLMYSVHPLHLPEIGGPSDHVQIISCID